MATMFEASREWPVIVTDTYTAELDEALLRSRDIAAVVIPGYLGPAEVALLNGRLDDLEAARYADGLADLAARGPRQWQGANLHDRDWYFAQAQAWATAAAALYRGTAAGTDDLMARLADGCPRVPVVAHEGSRRYSTSTVLTLGKGAALHYDRAAEDGPGWAIAACRDQLGQNLYLRNGETGGELVVYRRRGRPHPEAPGNYAFSDAVVAGATSVTITPGAGDVVLFNTGHYHQVTPAGGADRRRSVANFIGRTPDGATLVWA